MPRPHASCCRRSSRCTDADIATLKTNGYLAWLTASYNQPLGQTGVAWLDSRGHNSITSEQRYFWPQFGDFMIWNQLLAGPDQMRKRIALALSEFFVVSLSPIDGFYPPYVIGAYWDVLTANAFGNFRTLLERITLNAGMGFFLNTKGNLKEDANGRQPDENYAREVMQLFTIGLYELNPDGTPQARRQQPAHRNLRPERHHQSRARVHRLRLGLSVQWRHVHRRRLARLRRAEHALRHQPDVVQPEQPFEPGGELSRHEDSGEHARAAMRCTSRSTGCSITRTPARSSRGR